MPGETFSMLP